jgi:hypothetical protein
MLEQPEAGRPCCASGAAGKFCNNSIDQRVGLMVYSKNQSARAAGCAGEYAAGGEPEAVFTVYAAGTALACRARGRLLGAFILKEGRAAGLRRFFAAFEFPRQRFL